MADNSERQSPTFKIALGVFTLIGFAQLMAVGVAYTKRAEASAEGIVRKGEPEVVVLRDVREVEKIVIPEVPMSVNPDEILKRYVSPVAKTKNVNDVDNGTVYGGEVKISPDRSNRREYVVKHPRVSRLLSDAYRYYVRADMGKAVMLLEEAVEIDPAEPAVIDMQARVAEDMGALSRARDLYLKNFSLGVSVGRFYRRAAYKIEHGVGHKPGDGAVLFLGLVNIDRGQFGNSASINVPVRAREGETIVNEHLEIQVHLYDLVNGTKIEPAAKNSSIVSTWQGSEIDWLESGVETVRVDYEIPRVDEVERHLYGSRRYYGQVVEIYYRGVLQDMVAHPNILHKEHAKFTYRPPEQLQPMDLLDNFNTDNPLLPELPLEEQLQLPR